MKAKILMLLVTVTLVAGGIYLFQSMRSAEQQAQIASLRSEVEQKAQEVHELEASKELINRQRAELLRQAQAQAKQLQDQSQTVMNQAAVPGSSAAPSTGGATPRAQQGLGSLLAKMMEDPETKKFMRVQQRLVMDQLHAPLFKQLGLTPEESEKFSEILADNAMRATENASLLFGTNAAARAETRATLAADHQNTENQLKELLGESRFAQYKEYQQTAGERMQLNMFNQQAGAGALALTDSQTEQLLSMMKEEKQALTAVGQHMPGMGQDAANLEALLSKDQSETMLGLQESVNERVYERAKGLLSEEQLAAFGKFQTNQLQMMRAGVGMARTLFNPDGASGPAPVNP
jgi:hypothetical protein